MQEFEKAVFAVYFKVRKVDAGEHDLFDILSKLLDLPHYICKVTRSASAAKIWDEAIRAKVVAAVLHLYVSAQPRLKRVAMRLIACWKRLNLYAARFKICQNLFSTCANNSDSFLRKLLRFVLARAAANVYLCLWVKFLAARKHLPGFSLRFVCHGAGVDDVGVRLFEFVSDLEALLFKDTHERIAFIFVDFAAQSLQANFHL